MPSTRSKMPNTGSKMPKKVHKATGRTPKKVIKATVEPSNMTLRNRKNRQLDINSVISSIIMKKDADEGEATAEFVEGINKYADSHVIDMSEEQGEEPEQGEEININVEGSEEENWEDEDFDLEAGMPQMGKQICNLIVCQNGFPIMKYVICDTSIQAHNQIVLPETTTLYDLLETIKRGVIAKDIKRMMKNICMSNIGGSLQYWIRRIGNFICWRDGKPKFEYDIKNVYLSPSNSCENIFKMGLFTIVETRFEQVLRSNFGQIHLFDATLADVKGINDAYIESAINSENEYIKEEKLRSGIDLSPNEPLHKMKEQSLPCIAVEISFKLRSGNVVTRKNPKKKTLQIAGKPKRRRTVKRKSM